MRDGNTYKEKRQPSEMIHNFKSKANNSSSFDS